MGLCLYTTPESSERGYQVSYGTFAAFCADLEEYFDIHYRPLPPAARKFLLRPSTSELAFSEKETTELYDLFRPHLRGFQQWCDDEGEEYHGNLFLHVVELLEHAVDYRGTLRWD